MSYIPHTDIERQQMLAAIGVPTIEDLFEAVPSKYRFPALDLPAPMSEMEVMAELRALSEANDHAQDFAIFRGAGAYHHYIPSAVNHILLRGEFLTAYTPYQPEVSQGTLQAIFEYQSMITQLTGMDGANASHYDGATSLAEVGDGRARSRAPQAHQSHPQPLHSPALPRGDAHLSSGQQRPVRRRRQPPTRSAIWSPCSTKTPPCSPSPIPISSVRSRISRAWRTKSTRRARCWSFVANPMALALFKSPGELGADIVVGEGQPLGIPLELRRTLSRLLRHQNGADSPHRRAHRRRDGRRRTASAPTS